MGFVKYKHKDVEYNVEDKDYLLIEAINNLANVINYWASKK
jgi:hypothetical protein